MRENTERELDNQVECIPIYRWMGEGLKLKGNALVVYALIYEATLRGGCWSAPLSQMRAWTATKSMTPIYTAVSKLVLAGLVARASDGVMKADGEAVRRAVQCTRKTRKEPHDEQRPVHAD